MRVGIAGLAGRMGLLLAEEVRAAGHILTGGTVRPGGRGRTLPDQVVFPDVAALAAACDAVIDFTHADAVRAHAAALGAAGPHREVLGDAVRKSLRTCRREQ